MGFGTESTVDLKPYLEDLERRIQPEWNDMEVIYQNTIDKGLVILGMPEEDSSEPDCGKKQESATPITSGGCLRR